MTYFKNEKIYVTKLNLGELAYHFSPTFVFLGGGVGGDDCSGLLQGLVQKKVTDVSLEKQLQILAEKACVCAHGDFMTV